MTRTNVPSTPPIRAVSQSTQKTFDELQTIAVAILQQCPQLELTSFARRLGLPFASSNGRWRLAKGSEAAIAQLQQAGIIQRQAPTAVRESVMVCRPGYQPKQPGNGYRTPCYSSFDPFLKGAWQPQGETTRRAAAMPIAVNWRQTKPSIPTEQIDMTRTKENLERALEAVKQAEQEAIERGTYTLPSRNKIGVSLGLDDYFYGGTIGGKQATAEYNAAQTRLTLQRAELECQRSGVRSQELVVSQSLTTPFPTPPTPDPYRQRLEEDNARLRGEIEALRAEREQAPPAHNDRSLLQALKNEDQKLRGEADGLLLQIDALQRQHQCKLTEANAIQRLIEQREGAIEQAETAVVAVAATNGHRQLAGVAR